VLRKRRPRAATARGLRGGPTQDAAAEPRAQTAADPLDRVLSTAIAWLGRRDHCGSELAARLERRGFSAGLIEQALEALRERGYLDDERYAREFVRAHVARGQGPKRIRYELVGLGVAAGLAESTLQQQAQEHGGWGALARHARQRRFGHEWPAERLERARQARFLQSRGFSPDHIRTALGQYAPDELDVEPPDEA
jgi:regulatory protein